MRSSRYPLSLGVIALLIALPGNANAAFTGHVIGGGDSNLHLMTTRNSHKHNRERTRRRIHVGLRLQNIVTPEPSTQDASPSKSSYSNFWYSVVRKEEKDHVVDDRVPYDPDLDREGPLPAGAYLTHSDPVYYDPQAICRVTVAVDLTNGLDKDSDYADMDPSQIVGSMQKLLDAGMASFQLKSSSSNRRGGTNTDASSGLQEWGQEQIFGRLRKETPASALRNCHMTVPLQIPGPNAAGTVTAASVRQTVLAALSRTGGDCIDTIQLLPHSISSSPEQEQSPYALDVLDYLEDLKRQGYVRSVAGKSLDWRLVREAHRCGFRIDSNQVDGNLLDPTNFDNPQQRLACQDLGTKLLVAGPLAGGLLSGRHYIEQQVAGRQWRRDRKRSSPSQQQQQLLSRSRGMLFTRSESHHLDSTLVRWGEQHGCKELCLDDYSLLSATRWKMFQSKLLATLNDIAQKHDVSVSTVALRWTLQTEHVASTVVSCRLASSDNVDPRVLRERPKQLRQVFQLDLDDEDMGRLWEVSGRLAPEPLRDYRDDAEEEELLMEMMERENKGLFLPSKRKQKQSPDRSIRTLWL